MDKTKMYILKNRSAGMTGYNIPELGVRREFMPGETKTVSYEELEKLSFQPGGRVLMRDFLQLMDAEVTEEFNIQTEPEYYMSEEQIIELIKTGSVDAFLDALDYAPVGVIDLIKQFAVNIPITDTQKIRALKEKTGFDVEAALKNIELEKQDTDAFVSTAKSSTDTNSTVASGRRTTGNYKVATENKYKIINSEEDK